MTSFRLSSDGTSSMMPDEPQAAPAPAAALPVDLLRLDAACPRCGTRPALRISDDLERAIAELHKRDSIMATYQCQRRGCGEVYPLTGRAFADARP